MSEERQIAMEGFEQQGLALTVSLKPLKQGSVVAIGTRLVLCLMQLAQEKAAGLEPDMAPSYTVQMVVG